jgi:hypothetical protein
MENIEETQSVCVYCNKTAKQKCSRCHSVYYCNKDCQSEHYRIHKQSCKPPFKIEKIPGKGKGMMANTFIPQGTLILSERPIMITNVITDIKDVSSHLDNLRVAVSKLESKKKRQLFRLYNARPDLQILGLFGSNSISLPHTNSKTDSAYMPRAAVFPTLSRINHSCAPNVVWSWNDQRNCEELRAAVDIAPDSELTASYVDILLTSSERKEELGYKYDFICQCAICGLPSDEVEKSDKKRKNIVQMQFEVKEMVQNKEYKDAYAKSNDILEMAQDLGMEVFSILPQFYLDCYQLCCKSHGDSPVNDEAIHLYDAGREWAIKLRGNNTIFSKLDPPTKC